MIDPNVYKKKVYELSELILDFCGKNELPFSALSDAKGIIVSLGEKNPRL